MTYTPGPWKAETRGADASVVCPDGRSFLIGDIIYHGENFHNARLIAAAPELLAALKALFKIIDEEYGGGIANGYWPTVAPVYKQAIEAIAKAEGE